MSHPRTSGHFMALGGGSWNDPLPRELELLNTAVTREWGAWEAGLPRRTLLDEQSLVHPYPLAGGLPPGWDVVAHLPAYQPDTGLFLIRRTDGGWVIVRHEADLDRSRRFWVDSTLGDLYTHVTEEVAEGKPSSARLVPVQAWLREALLSCYDTTDPDEAAEQMLFALTGQVGALPRAAR